MQELLALQSDFPERLRNIPDIPRAIYLLGRLPEEEEVTVGIIGARDGTGYGKAIARRLAGVLSQYGIGIVSGMAYGIDTAAHEGALSAGGKTYAVLGSGADICYPAANRTIYEKIKESGGIISEYAPGSPPLPHHFVERNRLLAGLSDVLIVIEAKERSGTFITVDRALEQGKQVFAVPGRITDPLSKGCNKLLQEGASLCLSATDILRCFSIEEKETERVRVQKLPKEERAIYQALGEEGKELNALVRELKIPINKLYALLLNMEISGYCEVFGNTYHRRTF